MLYICYILYNINKEMPNSKTSPTESRFFCKVYVLFTVQKLLFQKLLSQTSSEIR